MCKLSEFKQFDHQKPILLIVNWKVLKVSKKRKTIYLAWVNKLLLLDRNLRERWV